MFKYDRNNGEYPKLGDKVKLVHINDYFDLMSGEITGWGDMAKITAIVTLDSKLLTGEKTVTIPVVCLKRAYNESV